MFQKIPVNFNIYLPTLGIPTQVRKARRNRELKRLLTPPKTLSDVPLRIEDVFHFDFSDAKGSKKEDRVKEMCRAFLDRHTIDCPVAAVIEQRSLMVRNVRLPPVELRKVPDIMTYEARQEFPLPVEDMEWRYIFSLGDDAAAREDMIALESSTLLGAVARKNVLLQLSTLRLMGFRKSVDALFAGSFLLADFVWMCQSALGLQGDSLAGTIVLDMGASESTMIYFDEFFVHVLPIQIGGDHFTEEIASTLGCDVDKAEEVKRDDGRTAWDSSPKTEKLLASKVDYGLRHCLSARHFSLSREIQPEKIIFTGGGLLSKGLKVGLMNKLSQAQWDLEEVPLQLPSQLAFSRRVEVNNQFNSNTFQRMIHPLTAAIERLGLGKYRANFHPKPELARPCKKAWGLEISSTGLTACLVTVQK